MPNRGYKRSDFSAVCDFFNEIYALNQNQHSWLPARWVYAEYLVCPLFTKLGLPHWHSTIRIWENDLGEIVGVVSSETPDQNVFLQVHPKHRHIEREMLEWAERYLAVYKSEHGNRELTVWSCDSDKTRVTLLQNAGFAPSKLCEYLNVFEFNEAIELPKVPKGYRLSSLEEVALKESRCACSNAAFDATGMSLDIYEIMQNAPLYQEHLDICSVHLEKQVASFCTIWHDEKSGVAYYEPVGTHPEHQRLGLGKAVLLEGLRRLEKIGAKRAFVGSWGPTRQAFYHSAGFKTFDAYRPWVKVIKN